MKLMLFAPELYLLMGSLVLFLISLGQDGGRKARAVAMGLALFAIPVCLFALFASGELFHGAYRVDLFSQFIKLVTAIGFAFVMFITPKLKGIGEKVRPEYYLFMTLSTLGLFMLVSSVELLTMFIALELSSYSLYLLVPMRDDRAGLRMQMESAIKYVLFGVVATGVMLFGMSYLYGLTGTTYFVELLPMLQQMMASPAALVALAMVLGGFFFKLAVFPFHSWVPDVYQGAANETTAFIASVPKVAAVAMLIRICAMATSEGQALVLLIGALSVCSMFYGNLLALQQTDLKRMLGFSGIAHAGYVLLGLVTMQEIGYTASIYYILAYLFMTLAGFLVICAVSENGENLTVSDVSGLHRRSPLLALTLAVSMFALAGIPPFAGFMGKFLLLTVAYNAGFLPLVILAALNTAISIYYYLSVVRAAYSNGPEEQAPVAAGPLLKVVSVALVAIIIVMGLLPDRILWLATYAVRAVF